MADGQQPEAPGADGDWIDARVHKASETMPVSDATAVLLKDAMRSKMANRPLPSGELAELAKKLIASALDSAK